MLRVFFLGVMLNWQVSAQILTNSPGAEFFPTIAAFLSKARSTNISSATVEGVVTYTYRRNSLYIQDGSGGLFVSLTQTNALQLGDFVQVTGQSSRGGFSPILEKAALVKLGTAP